jgi:catechol 2,3-dioxygenase-like lactoylglutathione lyase family enzyme
VVTANLTLCNCGGFRDAGSGLIRRPPPTAPTKGTIVLESSKAFSGFAVKDVAAARTFYGDTLGLRVSESNGMLRLHLAGDHTVLVYPKPDHIPATFTVLNFPVADIEEAVDALTAAGVVFETYEGTRAATDPRGIFRGGGPLIAWFTDPSGNVLSVLESDDPSAD